MEKTSWADKVKNEEESRREGIPSCNKKKANLIGHILPRNTLLKEGQE